MVRRSKRKKDAADAAAPTRAPTIIAGSVREPQDQGSLPVALTFTDTRISMHADTLELGDWPRGAVVVTPKDEGVFVFAAEGDAVLFTPDDPQQFTELMGLGEPQKAKRRGWWTKKRTVEEEESAPIISYKDPAPLVPKTYEVSTAKTASPVDDDAAEDPVGPPASTAAPADTDEPLTPPAAPAPKADVATEEATETVDREAASEPVTVPATTAPSPTVDTDSRRDSRWIRTLDTARRYGMFSLDRVPVDESLRGKEHRHTYEHRAAATSGPGARICTLCGKIKR